MLDYIALGKRIKKERKAQKMTQEDLASRAGISLSFLGHIERGTRKASLDTLVNIANALMVSTDMLLQESLSYSMLREEAESIKRVQVLREINKILQENSDKWE